MAARQPPSSSSRRGRTGDLAVGSFRIGNEIGKGSFATVYRGHHAVSSLIKAVGLIALPLVDQYRLEPFDIAMIHNSS